jgi:DNA repair protein SbcD/Mre11
MSVRILTTADLHIGRVSSNSELIDDRGTTRETWHRLVDWAIENEVDAVAVAGDIVEHDNRYFEAVSALESGLSKLDEAEIKVFVVAGNHDYDVIPSILRDHRFEHVHLLGEGGSWEFKTVNLNGSDIQFTGWSFPGMHHRTDPLQDFPSGEVDSSAATIGLIHGDYNAGESQYAPLQFSSLTEHGVNAWVMGHIHKPGVFNTSDPLIYYPGSPHALSPKEKETHGPVLLTVQDNRITGHEQITFSPVRYEELQIDISDIVSQDEIRAEIIHSCETFAESLVEGVEHLKLLSIDVMLTGQFENVPELENWLDNWDIQEFQSRKSGYLTVIRKVAHMCRVKVGNLEALSREPSPAGLLAQAIIDLEGGKTSEFIESLCNRAADSISGLNVSGPYLALRDSEEMNQIDPNGDEVNELILKECHRLLSELIVLKEGGLQ